MPVFDHLGITITDLPRAIAQWHPLMAALGFTREDEDNSVAWWKHGETMLILYPVRDESTAPHEHGRVGWQHLAFEVSSRAEVDQLHGLAQEAGWQVVRAPKEYPRFTARYYATFLEDADGVRIEFMHNPPRAKA